MTVNVRELILIICNTRFDVTWITYVCNWAAMFAVWKHVYIALLHMHNAIFKDYMKMLTNVLTLQGNGFTLIYGRDRPKQVPTNTPTSMDVPFYEV